MKSRIFFFPVALMGLVIISPLFAFDTTIIVDTRAERQPISPYIYGTNAELSNTENWTVERAGGNRWTGYNWETNASNAGSDWNHSSDNFLEQNLPAELKGTAGSAITYFHDHNLAEGRKSILTLQMAGYVAADTLGDVSEAETAPSARWNKLQFRKSGAYAYPPNLNDGVVYMDELLDFLVNTYGPASGSSGILGYCLDNEPALWSHTHPRIHPENVGCEELVNLSIELARVIKEKDPAALTFGPVLYGMAAYGLLQEAADWPMPGDYEWFIDYYLDMMKQASDRAGVRLLDVLDVHWYPEAYGDNLRIVFSSGAGTEGTQRVRVAAPRTLWDSAYTTDMVHEDSWIANEPYWRKFLPLIPKLKASINKYYPGTKLAITEWNYGGGEHITGAVATADVVGIFGREGMFASTLWPLSTDEQFTSTGFKLYRNYDGNNSVYGDISVRADTGNIEQSSAYAAINKADESELHIILINKHFTEAMKATIDIYSNVNYVSSQVWGFDGSSPAITQQAAVSSISGNKFSYSVPPLSAVHLILEKNSQTPPSKATPTPTPAPTPTPLPQSAAGDIKVQYICRETTESTVQMMFSINIINNSSAPVALERLTARYWFEREGTPVAEELHVDYTPLGIENIAATFAPGGICDIAFLPAAGALAANGGETGTLPIRINKVDWTSIRQNGDYSFDPAITSLTDYMKITLYRDGVLIWGTEPGYDPGATPGPAMTPTRTPTLTPTSEPANTGDVNGDGSISIVDALMVAQYAVGLNPQNFNVNNADADCNGSVNIVDALIIAQYSVGLIKRFC